MTVYLSWMLRQLYLIVFWPSLFERETEARGEMGLSLFEGLRYFERLRYLVAMTPVMVIVSVLATAVIAPVLVGFDVYASSRWWLRAAVGVASGAAVGVAFGVVVGVAFGVVAGVAFAVAAGVAGSVAAGVAGSVAAGVAFGVVAGVAVGVAFAVAFGVAVGVAGAAAFGVVAGVAGAAAFGVAVALGVMDSFKPGVAAGIAASIAFWAAYFRLPTYPLEAALSLISASIARHDATRGWRWCPARWDEVVWLPLPRLSSLLVRLVREDRDGGLSAINFVAAERPLQRRAAQAALLQVALDDLQASSLQEIALKAERRSWWMRPESLDPYDELERALADFDRIAQQVSQYLVLQSAFQRAATLDAAIGGLEALQRNLGLSRPSEAAPLLRVANTWRLLLDVERGLVRDQAAVRREIPNPFVFGNPVGESHADVFTGRRDLVRLVEASLLGAEHPPTLLLYGARRMGKSSILKQLPRLLGPAFVSADLDCQNPAARESPATLLRYLSRAVGDGLRRRALVVEPLTAQQLEREPYAAFDEWLDRVEQALPPGARLLIGLDEYERLQDSLDAGWGDKLLDALRHTIQHRARTTLMFVGTHTFAELGPTWTDRFISARRLRVSFLTPDEVRPLLTTPIPEFDLTYEPDALEAIIVATHGQPFLTQAVAFDLVQYMNEQGRKEAVAADVEEAIRRALESGGEYFADVWNDAGKDGQAILLAAAAGDPLPDFLPARRWLIDHDVLGDDGRFLVPMMERWVREQIVEAKRSFGSRR